MLTAFSMKNFKSYREATLPLGALTVLIGANASGKSNAIEGLRLISWLAQGHKLSSIQHAVQESEKVVRGRINELGYLSSESFAIGCETTLEKWNRLDMTLSLRKDALHISEESITSPDTQVPLYTLDAPSEGMSSDAWVAYNNFARGGKKPHITCSDQQAIFVQLDSPATFESHNKESRKIIPEVVRQYQNWLSNILFLDSVPARMRDYSFVSEREMRGDGG